MVNGELIMKIKIVSDIHFEFHKGRINLSEILKNDCNADVLVLAGDICDFHNITFIVDNEQVAKQYKKVYYVFGNHEYYGISIKEKMPKLKNVTILNNTSDVFDGVTFFGGILYNDITNDIHQVAIESYINDYRYIKDFNSFVAKEIHDDFVKKVDEIKPDVVISHFAPAQQSIHEKFVGSVVNSYFANKLDQFIHDSDIKLWIHGHVHDAFNYELGGTRVVCNPYGYPNEVGKNGFKSTFVEI